MSIYNNEKDPNVEMLENENRREISQKWWNSLSFEARWNEIVKGKHLINGYPDRSPNTLTGREIEMLFNNSQVKKY